MVEGRVYLVGAGPGDEKLITLKGIEALAKCDVVVYDRLSNPRILGYAPAHCEQIYVGKESGNHTMSQEDINELLVQKAKEGKIVVRLKGGDPYVFGRGGEEALHLVHHGISFEVVPGITSAIGGLCYGGIPITQRGYNTSFHVFTGHFKEEEKELDFATLSKLEGTLVFLMGFKNLGKISKGLLESGKKKDTPVAIIHWATHPHQKVVVGNLENIVKKAQEQKITSPSLIVVGEVVALQNQLDFQEKKPLFGKNILITRPQGQGQPFIHRILELGGNPIVIPAIEIKDYWPNDPLSTAIDQIKDYQYLLFTSVNGVRTFMKALGHKGYDVRKLGEIKIIAIGPSTKKALEEHGINPDILPKNYVAESVYEALKPRLKPEDKILFPRSQEGRPYLVEALQDLCTIHEIPTYTTQVKQGSREELKKTLKECSIDYITFTSASTVKAVVELLGEENLELLKEVTKVSIGPMTSGAMKKLQLSVDIEAKKYDMTGILEGILTKEENNDENSK